MPIILLCVWIFSLIKFARRFKTSSFPLLSPDKSGDRLFGGVERSLIAQLAK